ncbi:MAG: DNA polymerase III subunit chi [Anaerolineae bacterium]
MMSPPSLLPQVIFLRVKENEAKLHRLSSIALEHFIKKERLVILGSDPSACEFVDLLLWRLPREGFLPHCISETPSSEWITITHVCPDFNPDQTLNIFNLKPTSFAFDSSWQCRIKIIYDFDDHISEEKKLASKERYQAYRQAGLPISMS